MRRDKEKKGTLPKIKWECNLENLTSKYLLDDTPPLTPLANLGSAVLVPYRLTPVRCLGLGTEAGRAMGASRQQQQ